MDDTFFQYPGQILREGSLGVFTQSPFLPVHFHWTTTMLARMQGTLVNTLLKKADHSLRHLVQDIAEHSGIRPLSTQGHLGDIVPGRLVYDAQTTGGSSGSPVFNITGKVIAVNSAYLEPFRGGASFGVPISQALALIPQKP